MTDSPVAINPKGDHDSGKYDDASCPSGPHQSPTSTPNTTPPVHFGFPVELISTVKYLGITRVSKLLVVLDVFLLLVLAG